MPKPSIPVGVPRDVSIKTGQTIVLHDGFKVMLRAIAAKDTRYFTAWQSIVGTEAEVNAKIVELNLA
jgi:hypothetical protein